MKEAAESLWDIFQKDTLWSFVMLLWELVEEQRVEAHNTNMYRLLVSPGLRDEIVAAVPEAVGRDGNYIRKKRNYTGKEGIEYFGTVDLWCRRGWT